MNFSFASSFDSDFFRSASGLIKGNNGCFRSSKQRWMLTQSGRVLPPWNASDAKTYSGLTEADVAVVKTLFGIDAKVGQKGFMTNGVAAFGYSGMSDRPVSWFFLTDEYGIVGKYKLKFRKGAQGGWMPLPASTEAVWVRPADATLTKFEEPKPEPIEVGAHVGKEGKREVFELTIDSIKNLGYRQIAYNVGGDCYVTTMRDAANNVVKTFTFLGENVKVGDKVRLKATVKSHGYFRGRCETVINRCRAA